MIKVNNEIVEIKRFPDGTLNIKGNSDLMNSEVVIAWHYDNDAEFMAIAFLTKFYQAHGCNVILYMPYVPNARMDRVKYAGEIFTMKYFGELINSLNFNEVWIHDAHSSVASAVIQNVRFVDDSELINYVVNKVIDTEKEIPIIFFPDEGSMKRYGERFGGLPRAFAIKNRDWNSGVIKGMYAVGINNDDVKGKPVIIRDDICSYGGTFYYAAKMLKEMGAGNIYLFVTHCEDNIHKGHLGEKEVNLLATGLIKKVFTTDSIYTFNTSELVEVLIGELIPDNSVCECCNCSDYECDECRDEDCDISDTYLTNYENSEAEVDDEAEEKTTDFDWLRSIENDEDTVNPCENCRNNNCPDKRG